MTALPAAGSLTLAQQVSLLSGGDVWRTQPLPAVGVPSGVLSDGPHGLRFLADAADQLGMSGSEQSTCFPTAVTIASTWDEGLAAEIGEALAGEARALGVDVVLGPGLNIKRHPLCGRNIYSGGKLRLASVDILLDILNGRPGHAATRALTSLAQMVGRGAVAIMRRRR